MASSERRLPTSSVSRPTPRPTPQLRPPAPTTTATLPKSPSTSVGLLWLSPPVTWRTRTAQPSADPCCSHSAPQYVAPSSTCTPNRRPVFKSSVCSSAMPTCRRSGSAPKSWGGGSKHRAPRAFSSSPHQCHKCKRFSRVNEFRRSNTVTCAPSNRSSMAARRPLGPAPTMTARRPARRPPAQGACAYSARPHLASSFIHSCFAFQCPPRSTRMAS
mmetsp:Transcript_32518/g.101738  ORF Transcript_32518/g.101738 Transcript_32518/m.101738 type:complete len:216 (-) Transcript_32518:386-1033(-)